MGKVYAAVTNFMPSIVKIGFTSGCANDRAESLSYETELPKGAFEILAWVEGTRNLEKLAHTVFSETRLPGSEYFTINRYSVAAFFKAIDSECHVSDDLLMSVEQRKQSIADNARERCKSHQSIFDFIEIRLAEGCHGLSIGQIAKYTGQSISTVSRLTKQWAIEGKLTKVRVGKSVEIRPSTHNITKRKARSNA